MDKTQEMLEKAKAELSDEKLGEVSGGMLTSSVINQSACRYCDGSINFNTGYCSKCGKFEMGRVYVVN